MSIQATVDNHVQTIAEIHNVAAPNVMQALRYCQGTEARQAVAVTMLSLKAAVRIHVDSLDEMGSLNPGEREEWMGLSKMFVRDAAAAADTSVTELYELFDTLTGHIEG